MSDQITNLPISALRESPTNPRTSYNEVKLAELADSIKVQGVMQPIVVRPIYPQGAPTHARERYEVVFGHRRLRASILAGLEWVPTIIREMTDEQVATAQLIENFQREDVTALEEAEGFRRLIDEFRVTVPDLIKQTGKSKAFVYGRLKLVHLAEAPRKALADGTIDAEVGQMIARLPQAVQAEALANVVEHDTKRNARVGVSSREAKRRLANYLTDLSEAAEFPLDHAGLTDTGTACTGCVKRSGNSPDLQADLGDNVCTDRKCFEVKSVAFVQLRVESARANGQPVVEGDAAREIQRHPVWPIDGHVRVTDEGYGGLYMGTHPVSELLARLGDKAPAVKLLVHPDVPGKVVEIVSKAELQQAIEAEHGQTAFLGTAPDDDEDDAPKEDPRSSLPPEQQAVLRPKSWELVRGAIIDRVRGSKRTADDLRLVLLRELLIGEDFGHEVVRVFGWQQEIDEAASRDESELAVLMRKLDELGPDDLAAVLMILAIDGLEPYGCMRADEKIAPVRLALAARYGVNPIDAAAPAGEVHTPAQTADTPSTGCAGAGGVSKGKPKKAAKAKAVAIAETPSTGCAGAEEAADGASTVKPTKAKAAKAKKKGKEQTDDAGAAGGSGATVGDLVDAMEAA